MVQLLDEIGQEDLNQIIVKIDELKDMLLYLFSNLQISEFKNNKTATDSTTEAKHEKIHSVQVCSNLETRISRRELDFEKLDEQALYSERNGLVNPIIQGFDWDNSRPSEKEEDCEGGKSSVPGRYKQTLGKFICDIIMFAKSKDFMYADDDQAAVFDPGGLAFMASVIIKIHTTLFTPLLDFFSFLLVLCISLNVPSVFECLKALFVFAIAHVCFSTLSESVLNLSLMFLGFISVSVTCLVL